MRLNVLDQGAGKPVVLLHGLFGAAKNLGVLARGLAVGRRVISMDMRNHGDSPHEAAMDYGLMAADVAATMDALGVPVAAVVGHSMGGKAAMMLALSAPEMVSRLVVMDIAPVAYYDHKNADYAAAMQGIALAPGLTRGQADAALAGVVAEAPLRAFLLNNLMLGAAPRWRMGLEEIAGAMGNLLGWPEVDGTYAGPALFLRGGASDYVTPAGEAEIKRLFPAAVVETVAGAGHWLHAEKPQEVVAALQGFVRRQEV